MENDGVIVNSSSSVEDDSKIMEVLCGATTIPVFNTVFVNRKLLTGWRVLETLPLGCGVGETTDKGTDELSKVRVEGDIVVENISVKSSETLLDTISVVRNCEGVIVDNTSLRLSVPKGRMKELSLGTKGIEVTPRMKEGRGVGMEGNDTELVTEDGTTDWKIFSVAVIILLLSTKVLDGCRMINVAVLDSTSVGIGTVAIDGKVVSEGKIVSVRSVARVEGVIEVEGTTEANSVERIGVLEGRNVSVNMNSLVVLIEGMTVVTMMLGWLGVNTPAVIGTEVEVPLESNDVDTAGVTSNVETLTLGISIVNSVVISIVSVNIGATDDITPVIFGVMDKKSVELVVRLVVRLSVKTTAVDDIVGIRLNACDSSTDVVSIEIVEGKMLGLTLKDVSTMNKELVPMEALVGSTTLEIITLSTCSKVDDGTVEGSITLVVGPIIVKKGD